MEPIESWDDLNVGRWYMLPGRKTPQKFAAMSVDASGYRTVEFSNAKGSVTASYLRCRDSELIRFIPVSSPRRRYESNADRQAAYRHRVKDRCAVVQEGDHLILHLAGVPTKFKVMSVPECNADLRRGKGHNVRYADIRVERL